MRFQLQVQSVQRDTTALADEELGLALVDLVRHALTRGQPPTVVTVARPDRIEVIGLAPVLEHGVHVGGFIASLTRAELDPPAADPRAVGLMGTLQVRQSPDGVPVPQATVFLEWPDCRWWHWRALVDPTRGELIEDTATIRRATDGDPLPDGLGRWWSLGRRQPWRVRLEGGSPFPLVH